MTLANLPWSSALLFLLAAVITFCIVYLCIDAYIHREVKRIRNFDARVGHDCYRDIKGIHR